MLTAFAVHFVGTGRSGHTEPHQGGADVFNRQKNEILNIERAVLSARSATSDLTEVPTLIVQHGSIHHPGKQVAVLTSVKSHAVPSLSLVPLSPSDRISLPHFSRDDFSDGASIFASSSEDTSIELG